MHQCEVIFTVYYPAFLQPLQVELGIEGLSGEPIKGKFQAHENFQMKTHHACIRYLLRRYIKSIDAASLRIQPDESPSQYLSRV